MLHLVNNIQTNYSSMIVFLVWQNSITQRRNSHEIKFEIDAISPLFRERCDDETYPISHMIPSGHNRRVSVHASDKTPVMSVNWSA